MERDQEAQESLQATLSAYLGTLDKLQRYAPPFDEGFVDGFRSNLKSIALALHAKASPGVLKQSAAQVGDELKSLWEASRNAVTRWQDDCRSLLRVLSEATRGLEARDKKCSTIFDRFATRVERISEAADVSEMRTRLSGELVLLKASIDELMAESQTIVTGMHDAVARAEVRYEQVRTMALADALTGLPNRRHAEEAMTEKIRAGAVWCAMLLDVDRFKKINDGHGHACGDAVLKCVADMLRSAVRATDLVCRWAGDEFLIVLDCDLLGAIAVGEDVGKLWGVRKVAFAGKSLNIDVKASSGLCQYIDGETIETFVARVDAEMYREKAGRSSSARSA